jgi:hypothetical protein
MTDRVWLNKLSGELIISRPYYETLSKNMLTMDGANVKYGTLLHAGYLLHNKYGVRFVVSLSTKKHFEDLGEL